MSDLEQLSTSTLIEDFATHRRYEDRLRKSLGHQAYEARFVALATALKARGKSAAALSEAPVPERPRCRLRPLADHVVILPEEAEAISEGGIIIPETAKAKAVRGEVLAVGPGRIDPGIGTVLPAVSIGDVVLFGRYSGVEVTVDEQVVLIMREEEVLGVLPPKEQEGASSGSISGWRSHNARSAGPAFRP